MNSPAFFKELPLILQVQGKPELVGFAVGVSKAIDPESGMTVNLSELMKWQEDWKQESSSVNFNSWFEVLQNGHQFFEARSQTLQAQCSVVQLKFFDQSELRLQNGRFSFSKKLQSSDSSRTLRVLKLELTMKSESDFTTARQLQIPDSFPGSWNDSGLLTAYLKSQFGHPPLRIEIWDPLLDRAVVI
jgi:hypothetical protein